MPVRSRLRSQLSLLIPSGFFFPQLFPATPLHPRRPQPSAAQFSAPVSRPQPSAQPRSLITSVFFSPPISSHSLVPTPSAAVHAILPTHLPSVAVRAAKFAHHQRLLVPTIPHPFPATPLHPRCPQPSAHFSAPIARPPPSVQPSTLITTLRTHFPSAAVRAAKLAHHQRLLLLPFPTSPLHPRRPQPSAQFSAPICRPQPSAAVRAAKVAHHQRLLLPTNFQPLRCTHAVRSRPRSSPHPFAVRSRPRSQGRSSPCFFSPPISSHPLAPTPSAAVRAVLRTHLPSAAVRAAKVAHHQRLLLPTHFEPPPCTHAVRSRPHSSPHPFAVRSRPRSQGRSSPASSSLQPFPATPFNHAVRSRPRSSPHPFAVRSCPRSQGRSSPAASSPHPFPATPLHPRRPQPTSLITSGFFSPPISSHPLAPTPSAAVRTVLRTHLPSAAVRAAKVAHHQRLLLSNHFQPPPCTHAVRSRPRSSPHPFAVRSRPRSQGRSSPAASSRHPFPATPLHPRRPQPSAQFSALICRPQPSAQPRSLITSGFFSPPISSHSVAPTPSAAVHAVLRTHLPSAAVRAAKVAHPAASSLNPFPATPLHPRHPQPSAQFSAPICRPQPSAQPRSLITSGFFLFPSFPILSLPFPSCPFLSLSVPSFPILSLPFPSPRPFPATPLHPRCPQPSAQFSAPICQPQPSAQLRSLITSGFFSPPISSHSVAPTPSAAVRAVLRSHLPSAAVRAAKVAHHQRLLLPTQFQPLRCTHAVRSRPRSSPHPFAVRSRPRSQGRSSPAASSPHPFPATPLHPRRPQPSAQFSAPICRPRSQGRSSPAASSPYPFRATPLHPRRPQPSAQFSAPICRPQPSAQPRSLITSGFFSPPISSHSVAPTPSAAVHAVLRTHLPSAAVRAAKVAHHRLLLPTHFQPPRCTHAVRSRPRSSPHPFAVRSRPRSQGRSSPAASSPHPFPATQLHPRRPQPSTQFPHPFAVRSRPRSQGR